MHKNAMQRLQVLEILYQHMEHSPKAPWVNQRELKKLGEIDFALVALQELEQIKQDGPNYRITGAGIEAYEAA